MKYKPKYKVVDDTTCEVLYFEKRGDAKNYVKLNKDHLLTVYIYIAGWGEITWEL